MGSQLGDNDSAIISFSFRSTKKPRNAGNWIWTGFLISQCYRVSKLTLNFVQVQVKTQGGKKRVDGSLQFIHD